MQTKKEKEDLMLSELQVIYKSKAAPLQLNSPQSTAKYFRDIWDGQTLNLQESFYAVFLNNHYEVIGWRLISRGTSTKCMVDIRLLCAIALQAFAAKIVVAHNHPGGEPRPSKEDKEITLQLRKALETFEISLSDHIILTPETYFSFVESGLLDNTFRLPLTALLVN